MSKLLMPPTFDPQHDASCYQTSLTLVCVPVWGFFLSAASHRDIYLLSWSLGSLPHISQSPKASDRRNAGMWGGIIRGFEVWLQDICRLLLEPSAFWRCWIHRMWFSLWHGTRVSWGSKCRCTDRSVLILCDYVSLHVIHVSMI